MTEIGAIVELPCIQGVRKIRWREQNYRGSRRFMDLADSNESDIVQIEVNVSEGELEDADSQNHIDDDKIVSFYADHDMDDEVLYGSNKSAHSYLARPASLRDECLDPVQHSSSQRRQEIKVSN